MKKMNVEKWNHQKIGEEMELFMSSESAPGMPFFLPNGMIIRNELENHWKRKHHLSGYQEIKTPIMLKQDLWEQSGHWEHYQENMYYSNVDDKSYCIKPMNCPGAILVYNRKPHSYRELPLKYAELGQVHRHELSGSLNGLFRVRSFTQDDAHLFVRDDQLAEELHLVLSLMEEFYQLFGFSYKVELSTRPEHFLGSIDRWERAEAALESVLVQNELTFEVNKGDGAFYGPKIDFHILDSLGRSWQCGTIQLDFQMPEKFGCTYIDSNQIHQTPILIHRAIYGSLERFFGILIEHYQGKFPLWLSPIQTRILPIAERHNEYADKLKLSLESAGFRVDIDDRSEKLGLKIREAEKQRIPYMVTIGDKEIEHNQLSIRLRGTGKAETSTLHTFIQDRLNELAPYQI